MKKLAILALAFVPSFAFAQVVTQPTGPNTTFLENFLRGIDRLVDIALPLVVSLALLAFFYGLMRFIFKASDPKAKDEGKSLMIWSVVALFVMVSVWGIVRFIGGALGIGQGGTAPTIDVPDVSTN